MSNDISVSKRVSMITLAAAVALGGLVFPAAEKAEAETWDSRNRPSGGTGIIEDILPGVLGKDWLLVQDNVPWWFDSIPHALNSGGYSWERIDSSQFAAKDLSGFRGIILPSDQVSSFYDNLAASKAKLESFVANGGVLVVHAAQNGWNSWPANAADYVPGSPGWAEWYDNNLDVTDPTAHEAENIDNGDLDGWWYSTHATITSAPIGTRTYFHTEWDGSPTYVSYAFGLGTVHVTHQTVEWGYANAVHGYSIPDWGYLLQNELESIEHHHVVPLPVVPPVSGLPVLVETFDAGAAPGWSLTGLWHVSSCRSNSAPFSLAYNLPGCPTNFDVGTTRGCAVSPSVSIPSTASVAQAAWNTWYQTELGATWDQKHYFVRAGGIDHHLGQEVRDAEKWHATAVDISAFRGQTIQLAFCFDSIDGILNGGEGWYIDDVTVIAL